MVTPIAMDMAIIREKITAYYPFNMLFILYQIFTTTMKKRILILVALVATTLPMHAQQQAETTSTKGSLLENSYLNVMGSSVINFDSDFNTYYYGSGFALQYGKWFSPTFAPQLSIAQHFMGSTYLTNISVDFLWNVSNSVNYKEDRAFSVILFTGVEAAICSRPSSTRSYPMLNIGGQLKYAINDSFDIIGELRGGVGYDGYGTGLPITDFLTAKLGFGYKFNRPNSKSKVATAAVTEFKPEEPVQAEAKEQKSAPVESHEVKAETKAQPEAQPLLEPQAEEPQAEEPQTPDARAQRWAMHQARMQEMGVAEGTDLYEMWRNIFEDKERVMEQYGADELIFFTAESSDITNQEAERLSPIAEKIKQNPSVVYSIEGYADATTGTASYNNKISLARANAVANALAEKFGVNRSQLSVVGKGGVRDIFEREHMNRCVMLIPQ